MVGGMDKVKNKYGDVDIPKDVLDAFARYIIPEIRRFHESEEGQAFYKEWLEKHPEYAENKKIRWGRGDLSGLFLLLTLSDPYLHSEHAVKEICVRVMSICVMTSSMDITNATF